METRHVKLNYEEALSAKKQILSAELNLLQTAKRVKNYKILRRRELVFKNKLKTVLKNLKEKLRALKLTLPEEEQTIEPKTTKKRTEKRKDKDIKNQLEEIKEKLAKLK